MQGGTDFISLFTFIDIANNIHVMFMTGTNSKTQGDPVSALAYCEFQISSSLIQSELCTIFHPSLSTRSIGNDTKSQHIIAYPPLGNSHHNNTTTVILSS